MLEYIKMFIISLISGVFAPLAVSSTAHFTFLNKVLHFSQDANTLGFYNSVIAVVFSLVVFVFLRKLYFKSIKAPFAKGKNIRDAKSLKAYRTVALNLLISLIPAAVMFIPVSKESFLLDVFDGYITGDSILVSAFCCFASGLILLVSVWYTRRRKGKTKRNSSTGDVVRFSLYQLPAFCLPGFSHVASGATALLVSDLDERVIAREVLLYLAPPTFVIGTVRIVRYLLAGLSVDLLMLAVCVAASLVSCCVIISAVGKINARKLFSFFSVYSIVFGIFISAASFFI